MSAIMKEVETTIRYSEVSRSLEPDGRGHELLMTWALFRRGGERSHSPFVSGYLKEPLDKSHEGEPPEVMAIDRLLAMLNRSGHWQSVDIVKRYYLSLTPVAEICDDMGRTAGFVRLTLRGVCGLVEERVTI